MITRSHNKYYLNNKLITNADKKSIKEFIGLYAINEKNPSSITKAKAYLNQYEKFENKSYYLDSVLIFLKDKTETDIKANLEPLVQLYFIKNHRCE